MKKEKKVLKSASVLAGALLTSTAIAATPSSNLLEYNDLGTGSEVRSNLIEMNASTSDLRAIEAYKVSDLKCGEGKCGGDEKKAEKKGEKKSKKSEGKSDKKSDKKAEKSESKTGESKCGEGTCGG